jgi:hypothetical protein
VHVEEPVWSTWCPRSSRTPHATIGRVIATGEPSAPAWRPRDTRARPMYERARAGRLPRRGANGTPN